MSLLSATFVQTGEGVWKGSPNGVPRCPRIFVTAQVFGRGVGYHNHEGLGLPERFGSQHTRERPRNMRPRTHELVAITVKADGKTVPPLALVPDVPVWSGISWVAKMYDARLLRRARSVSIEVRQRLERPKDVEIKAYAVWY